ncbi:hypothetical protein L1080_033705 [Rhodococcus sp. MSC1_016]|jgi:cyanate lyase|uniref:hypothetical protein n=1 Tax=Rhodococcus sp. MSC1_016 TaxID=2909266 RepID=UPI00202E3F73|nr:hypothetical protein [Rhodococcus sp. MSC1_016]
MDGMEERSNTGDVMRFSGSVTNEQVVEALRAQHEATNLAKWTLEQIVAVARRRGISWAEIGQALGGITKQAAQRKYAPVIAAARKDEERKVAELLGLSDEEAETLRSWG